jgi:hypothetical protein
MDKLG